MGEYLTHLSLLVAFKGPEMRKLMLADPAVDKIKQRMGGSRNQYAIIYTIAWLISIPVMLYAEKKASFLCLPVCRLVMVMVMVGMIQATS